MDTEEQTRTVAIGPFNTMEESADWIKGSGQEVKAMMAAILEADLIRPAVLVSPEVAKDTMAIMAHQESTASEQSH